MEQEQTRQQPPPPPLLYIRYPKSPWVLFDDSLESTRHQKSGLEMFIQSDKDSLDVSIPHYLGGQFMVEYGKNIIDDNHIMYFYIKTNLETVQMMYAKPEYIAYINRLTT
jgi:hypothetical protein